MGILLTQPSVEGFLRSRPPSLILPLAALGSSSIPGYSKDLERVMGIEPTSEAWKASILPLNYTRVNPNCGLGSPWTSEGHPRKSKLWLG